jgi:hypothetical protein
MPLMLVSMPLMLLPMSPGVELNLGNSLVPLTGMVLLLRSVIEGQYHLAWPFVLPVALVTLGCCLLAIRWAEEQFNRESVLFRESEDNGHDDSRPDADGAWHQRRFHRPKRRNRRAVDAVVDAARDGGGGRARFRDAAHARDDPMPAAAG